MQLQGRVILSDPPCKDRNARFTTVPLISSVEDIVISQLIKVFNFDNFSAVDMRKPLL